MAYTSSDNKPFEPTETANSKLTSDIFQLCVGKPVESTAIATAN